MSIFAKRSAQDLNKPKKKKRKIDLSVIGHPSRLFARPSEYEDPDYEIKQCLPYNNDKELLIDRFDVRHLLDMRRMFEKQPHFNTQQHLIYENEDFEFEEVLFEFPSLAHTLSLFSVLRLRSWRRSGTMICSSCKRRRKQRAVQMIKLRTCRVMITRWMPSERQRRSKTYTKVATHF